MSLIEAVKRFYALSDPLPFITLADLHAFILHAKLQTNELTPEIFKNSVLKRLVSKFESQASEDLIDLLYSLISSSDRSDGFALFFLDDSFQNEVALRVRESDTQKQLVTNGSTGFRVWDASRYLASFLLLNKTLIVNRRVLELGAGSGLCGLIAAKLGAHVTLTDSHAGVLALLEDSACRVGAKVQLLDWELPIPDRLETDIIIGSDLVYDPRLVEPLVNVLASLRYEYALICCAARTETTQDLFKASLTARHLHSEVLVSGVDAWSAILSDNFFTGSPLDLDVVLYRVTR